MRSEDKKRYKKENFADYRSVVAEDLDKVSDWAIPAYHTLGYNVPIDYEDGTELDAEGVPISIMFYRPSQNITRFEVSWVLVRIQENYQVYPSSLAVQYGFDKRNADNRRFYIYISVYRGGLSKPFLERLYAPADASKTFKEPRVLRKTYKRRC
ncbi:MAG: hypothetical protein L6V93_03925 [Clostridiales bacterium]|nr:MAG: hypothetical protein L6V93_03925 [Clostridiales bacterium]